MAQLDPKIKRLLSGMLTKKIPEADEWLEGTEFDSEGRPIPVSDKIIALEEVAESMSVPQIQREMTDAEVHEAAEIGQQIKKEIQRMLRSLGADKKEGMLTKETKNEVAEETRKPVPSKKENISKDVAEDLTKEALAKPKDKGRGLKGYKSPEKQEKRGYKQDDGGNWSVDTKAQHWQTKRGYDEAIKLYGNKPAWVKEPSLIYNPKTKSYDPIKVEKPKDVKPYKKISL